MQGPPLPEEPTRVAEPCDTSHISALRNGEIIGLQRDSCRAERRQANSQPERHERARMFS